MSPATSTPPRCSSAATCSSARQFGTASENDLLRGEAIALPIAIVAMVFLLGGLVAARHAAARRPRRCHHVARRARRRHPARRRVDLLDQRRQHARHRPRHRLRPADGQPVPRGTRPRPRRARRRRRRPSPPPARPWCSPPSPSPSRCRGLFVFGVPLLTSFGIAGLGVVLLCMAAAVTLLPADPRRRRRQDQARPRPSPDVEGRFYRLTRWVQSHAVAVGGAAVVVLVLLGVPFLSARFEIGDARTLPRSSEVRDDRTHPRRPVPGPRHRPRHRHRRHRRRQTPQFVAWFDQTLDHARRRRHRRSGPTPPPALTVVDVTPTGTSQGAAATALVDRTPQPTARRSTPRSAASPPSSSTSRPGSATRLPFAAAHGRRRPPSCCCS